MGDHVSYLNPPSGKASYLARAISAIINPVFAGVFITGSIFFQALPDRHLAAKWFGTTVFLTVTPPLSYILYLVKTGYLVDIFMPDRQRRIKPIGFIAAWVTFTIILLLSVRAPLPVILTLVSAMVLIGLLFAITLIWKISFHTAVLTTAATVTMMQDLSQAWIISLLIPLVGWSRVHLRRHTTLQVIGGSIAGCIVAIIGHYFLRPYLN